MIKAAIIGATGYTGLELIRILTNHPEVEISVITSGSRQNSDISVVFPSLKKLSKIVFREFDPDVIACNADIVFTALPHGSSMETVASIMDRGVRVVDLSADFRFTDISVYNKHYGEHRAPHLAGQSVYGLSELNRENIADANLVGNPGCYPTGAILPLVPLLREKIIDTETIVINSASGVSGAGRTATVGNSFCSVSENFKAYKIGEHRHNPEIDEYCKLFACQQIATLFIPHLAPMSRGILTTTTGKYTKKISSNVLLEILADLYNEEPFIRIMAENEFPDTLNVRGSNFCDIGAKVDERSRNIVIVSSIDNLVKGAAGQAVQNMNIMFGLPETSGLTSVPLSL